MDGGLNLETLKKVMREMQEKKKQSEVILFINIKDWLDARREMRKDKNIEIRRVGRTVNFALLYQGSFIADICVGTKNQLPVPDGKFLQMPKPVLSFEQKIKVEFEPSDLSNEGIWRRRWRF